jgi:ankyrin repeat protein
MKRLHPTRSALVLVARLALGVSAPAAPVLAGRIVAVPVPGAQDNAILAAAEAGQAGRVEELIAQGANLEARDVHGRTPLMAAAVADRADVVRLLLQKGSDVHALNLYGGNAMWFAVMNDRAEVGRILMEHGAGMVVDGEPAFFAAACHARINFMTMLLADSADVNQRDSTGATPLIRAASCGRMESVQFLIDHGADVHAVDNRGQSALAFAEKPGPFGVNRELIKILKKAEARK